MLCYAAPMEGITTYIYRRAHARWYGGIDKYFTPFIAGRKMTTREIRDILPENNVGTPLVPQILTNKADDFLEIARRLASYGYDTVNLNLGCPSGTVTAKKRGAGLLGEPEMLDAFLSEIFEKCPLKISIKTRLGISDLSEWECLLAIYARYPVQELIIHTRLLQEFYTGASHPEAFALAAWRLHDVGGEYAQSTGIPLCYNGDILSAETLSAIQAKATAWTHDTNTDNADRNESNRNNANGDSYNGNNTNGDASNGNSANSDGSNGNSANGDGSNGNSANGDGSNGNSANGDGPNGNSANGDGSGNPIVDRIMLGRGLLRNPALAKQLRAEPTQAVTPQAITPQTALTKQDRPCTQTVSSYNHGHDTETLRAFHNEILHGYQEIMPGDRPVLFKMKDLWTYMILDFVSSDPVRSQEGPDRRIIEKHLKKIRKADRLSEYLIAVDNLFRERSSSVV